MKTRLLFLLIVVASGIGYALYEPETETPITEEDSDTGLTRHETEELMRTIGYVQ